MFQRIYNHKIICLITILLLSAGGFILINQCLISKHQTNKTDITLLKAADEKKSDVVSKQSYYVDIKGAVVNPNVYQVTEGSRIIDVIKLAGGLTDQADTSVLNLSKKVSDEMLIIVYTKTEIAKYKRNNQTSEQIIKSVASTCKCPDVSINGACATTSTSTTAKISINTATKEQLLTLPNIGEAKAQAIIDYRTSNGAFTSIDDLKKVTGIGDSIFAKIKDYITT